MNQTDLPSGTVTFLFTDIEGSTRLWQQHPKTMPIALARHHALLQESFERNNGYVFQITGDAFCAAFATATDALNAAIKAQRALRDEPWGEISLLKVRMAVHTGPAEVKAGDYTSGEYGSGLTLSHTARLLSAGHGGQILLTLAAAELVQDYLSEDVTLRDMGAPRLKDLVRAGTIYQAVIPDLMSDFPPLKTVDVSPNNLPLQLTSFIGREEEISQVKELLTQSRMLTMIGAGGSGKTRLALQVAAGILDTYPDGVWLVELASLTDPTLVLQTISAVLGIREQTGQPSLKAVVDFVCGKEILLLMDNCEHLIEVCAQIADNLLHACPNVSLIATSRERLDIEGEHIFYVPSLELPSLVPTSSLKEIAQSEAVRLLHERAVAIQPSFEINIINSYAVTQICHRLDGIPLAIELAAARFRMLSPEQIASRLDDRFRLLTTGSRTALPRHQTLSALIDWSHDLLSEEERVLFRRLSVFSGGWTLDAAEQVGSSGDSFEPRIETEEVLELLDSLASKSLVIVDEQDGDTRYGMLKTIRAYSLTRMREASEEEQVRRAHLNYFLKLAEMSEPELLGDERAHWDRRLELEQDNLRGALAWALTEKSTTIDAESGSLVAGTMFMYWYMHGYLNEGRRWLDLALARFQGRTMARAKALSGSGTLAWQQGDYTDASICFDESIQLWRELGIDDGLAEAQHFSGHLEFDQRNYDLAKELFAESLDYYQQVGDTQRILTLMSDIGLVAYHLGDYASAQKSFEEALLRWRERGNQESVADVLNRLGDLARVDGRYDLARSYYEESLELFRTMNAKLGIASGLHKLGQVSRHQGRDERARELFRESLILQQETGNKQGIIECIAGIAGLELVKEEFERAVVLFGATEALLDALGAPLAPADRVVREGDLELLKNQLDTRIYSTAWAKGYAMTQDQAIEQVIESHS
jgi:predicted ATPase/class 3 adenylate cyclase